MARVVQDGKAGIDLTKVWNPTTTAISTDADPYPGFALGTRVWADSGLYIFCQASGTVGIATLCEIVASTYVADTATDTELGTLAADLLGVAVAAQTTGQFGWYWLGAGVENVSVATGIATATQLTGTANAGVAGSGGTKIGNLVTIGETSGGAAVISCMSPILLAVKVAYA